MILSSWYCQTVNRVISKESSHRGVQNVFYLNKLWKRSILITLITIFDQNKFIYYKSNYWSALNIETKVKSSLFM